MATKNRKTSIFTEEEKRYIEENYPTMDSKEMCKVLGVDNRKLRSYANSVGVKKEKEQIKFTEQQKQYILNNYNVIPTGEIAKAIGLTTKQVNDFGYRHIGLRDIERYTVDEDYFKTIDTEEKAYWLGFLYADGCVHDIYSKTGNLKSYVMMLSLARIDRKHIEKLNKSLKSNYEIKDYIAKSNGGEYEISKLTICNTSFCKNLISSGCVPRKSLILEFPNEDILPKKLIRHFIRGYFEGDGCVYFNEFANTTKCSVSFIGTELFLRSIQRIANEEVGFTFTNLNGKGNAKQVGWGGVHNCVAWYLYMYKDATIYLDRKYNKFMKIIEYSKSYKLKFDRTKHIKSEYKFNKN